MTGFSSQIFEKKIGKKMRFPDRSKKTQKTPSLFQTQYFQLFCSTFNFEYKVLLLHAKVHKFTTTN
jgi:hypothetical protein